MSFSNSLDSAGGSGGGGGADDMDDIRSIGEFSSVMMEELAIEVRDIMSKKDMKKWMCFA